MARRAALAAVLAIVLSVAVWLEPTLTLPSPPLRLEALLAPPSHALRLVSLLAPSTPTPTATVLPTPLPTATPIPPEPKPKPLTALSTVLAFPAPPIQARAAFLVDLETGKLLFAKNADERLPMASTTKITTAILAIQHSRLSDLVRVSRNAATIGESTMGLQAGERLTVRQLLYGLLLNSGNDAAIALAEHVSGTESRFVALMNRLARSLHMWHTHYVTPHGLDEPGHYTSARDLATIAQYALRSPIFRRIVATENYYVPPTRHNHVHWLGNINHVLYWYPGVNGVKPGDTDAAGLCQVISVHRDGRRLLAVLLNTSNLVTDIKNLLNFGLRDFRWIQAPAYWDAPTASFSGGSGRSKWIYYFGAGHYIRGLFLSYFSTHGGLQTVGYPRTEQIRVGGHLVQYFQNAELVYDPRHHSVYPAPLGALLQRALAGRPIVVAIGPRVAKPFSGLYRHLGGLGVFGPPIGGLTFHQGTPVQVFQYGEMALLHGTPWLVPLGDAALELRGWLPSRGVGNSYPPTMAPRLLPPPPPLVRHLRIRAITRHDVYGRPE